MSSNGGNQGGLSAGLQDFITFLTYGRNARWSAHNAAATGRITHFIVGNEVRLG